MLLLSLAASPALASGLLDRLEADHLRSVASDDILDPLSPDAAAKKKDGGGKSDGKKDGKGDGKKDGKKDGDGDKKKKDDTFLGFEIEPYVQPGGGVQIDSSGDMAITAGADVGVLYTKKKFTGNLYAGGAYITGEGVSGYDVHLGNTANYRAKYFGAGGGLALTYNGQTNTDTGKDILTPSLGVQVPVELVVGPKKYYGLAGVTPSWYFDEDRKPAAGMVPFGDEFEWHIGGGLKIDSFKAEAGYMMVFTAAGQYSVPTISVGYNP
jgi:hypothetical protein